MTELFLLGLILSLLFMLTTWWVAKRSGSYSIVDIAWTLNIILLAYLYAFWARNGEARQLLLLLMVTLSSGRLCYLLYDRMQRGLEDRRYLVFGKSARFYLLFFLFQGAAAALLSLPFLFISFSNAPLNLLDAAALLLFSFSCYFEWKSDAILHAFRQNPANKGKVCREGIFGRCRHPSYFFELLIWVSYALLALSAPFGIFGFAAPLLMFFFITKVTGIPPTEAYLLMSRGEEYRKYQKEVPALFPFKGWRDS